ncbi:glycerophosphodiester phosphodiesterase family protein [Pacificibacter sp. AS14]|uniref:glycerophosphodiester phosphodiesterase n=1 Tax=Pacificibacter sp. AS14 TaxID=3135785 RepID=UPI00316F8A59
MPNTLHSPIAPPPLFVDHAKGRTWLKWHRGRRCATDMEFDPRRIIEGMRLGASVEIDIVRHAGGGFAVLHDDTLERATTGSGRVCEASRQTLETLWRRGNEGQVTDVPVALLSDLCRAIATEGTEDTAVLQLDLKETNETLTPADILAFAEALAPITNHAILSAGDAKAVQRLSKALPVLRIGHDPCHFGTRETLAASGDDQAFIAQTLHGAEGADMIYLDIRLIFNALERGTDLIAAFHAKGHRIDAYTVSKITPQTVDLCRKLMALGVDQITTDDPERLYAAGI